MQKFIMLHSELARHLPLHSFKPLTMPLPEADVQAEDPTPVLFILVSLLYGLFLIILFKAPLIHSGVKSELPRA